MRLAWLIAALVLACILAGIHFVALDEFLYWYHPMLDIPMHFLAGLVMGTAVAGVLGRRRPLLFFGTVFAGAVGWELFEYVGSISTGQPDYWSDTFQDVLNGLLGAALVYLITILTVWRSR